MVEFVPTCLFIVVSGTVIFGHPLIIVYSVIYALGLSNRTDDFYSGS